MEEKWKYGFFSFDVVNLILICIITVITATLNTKFSVGGNILLNFASNWNNKYIMNITVSDKECSNSFSPIVLDIFPGTVNGCYCPNSTGNPGSLTRDSCSISSSPIARNISCSNIYSIPKKNFTIWKSKVLCAKNTYLAYLNLSIQKNNTTCSNNMKSCGRIDSINNNILCISENDLCPIKDIMLVSIDSSNQPNYERISFSNNEDLSFTRIDTLPAISQFKISEGLNCINPIQKNSFGPAYQLLYEYNNYPCTDKINSTLYDLRYTNISIENKTNLYVDNNLDQLFNLTNYPKAYLYNSSVTLFYRPFLGIDPNCRLNPINITLSQLFEITTDYDWISKTQLIQYISGIVVFSAYFIGVVVSLFRKYEHVIYLMQLYILIMGLNLIQILPNVFSLKYTLKIANIFQYVVDNKCFDDTTNIQLNYYVGQYNDLKPYLYAALIFGFLQIVEYCIAIFLIKKFLIQENSTK